MVGWECQRKSRSGTVQENLIRVLLGNTIETYPPEWRLIQEPLQNAIDSFVNEDGSMVDTGGEKPTVSIRLAIGSNLVRISDNGKGVPLEKCGHFVHLGSGAKGKISDRRIRKLLKGSQGVGIKSSVFTSEFFRIKTIHAHQSWELELHDFFNYSSPEFPASLAGPTASKTDGKSGTVVEIRLHDYSVWDFINDRIMDFFSTVEIDNTKTTEEGNIDTDDGRSMPPLDPMKILMTYLKKESYAGCVSRLIGSNGLPDIDFKLEVICDFPESSQEEYLIPGVKPFPANKALELTGNVKYIDFKEMIESLAPKQQPKIVSNFSSILESGKRFETPTVFYQKLNIDDIKLLVGKLRKRKPLDPSDPTKPNIMIMDQDNVYRHRTVLSRVNGGILFIASRPFLKNPLAHKASLGVSVNGLPTDITLDASGAELGHVPSVHLVLDVDETLGYGKRNLHPKSKHAYNNLMKDLWRNLHKLAKLIVRRRREL